MSVVLITGATSGHGRYLAQRLSADHSVLVHGRDRQRTESLARELGAHPYIADLSSLAAVHRLAVEVGAVDVLINNAGIGYGNGREMSADGFELRFAVNYLAPVVLMRALTVRSKVLNVGSLGQESIDFDDLMLDHCYSGVAAYRRAKLALAMATFDFAEQRPELRVNVVHPATYMDTNMVRNGGGTPQHTVEFGGENTLRVLGSSLTGRFFNEGRLAEAHRDAYQLALRARLRQVTDAILGAA